MTPRTALQEDIDASGLTIKDYAHTVLYRHPRTVRRWLHGDHAIPAAVQERVVTRQKARTRKVKSQKAPHQEQDNG